MVNQKGLKLKKRARTAYAVAYGILLRYLLLYLGKRIFGNQFYDKRIDRLHERNALKLKKAILELKGLFTKVGQLLSVMSNVLPETYAETLESLQDKAPPSDFKSTEKLIQDTLGESIPDLFLHFNQTPIASASIGQVYKAQLKSGEWVAVKVQHPDIEVLAETDLMIIEKLIKRVSFFFKINGIHHVYTQVRQMVEEELDYQLEAKSIQRIADQLSAVDGITVPKVYPEYSGSKIIVCAFCEGVKINNIAQLDQWEIDREALADRLIRAFCKLILEDGFYHADPHPGNILVNEKGEIILLDFGATAALNPAMKKEIPVLIQHIIRKDTPKIIRSLEKMGFLGEDQASKKVATRLVNALTTFVQTEIKIDNLNLKEVSIDDIRGSSLDKLRKEIGIRELSTVMQVPKDWILLERAIILIHGISVTIAPEYNPMDTVKPYLKKLVLSKGGLKTIIVDSIKQQFSALLQLPSNLNEFLEKANAGDLDITTTQPELKRMYSLGHQAMLFFAVLFLVYLKFTVSPVQHPYFNVWFWILLPVISLLLLRNLIRNRL